MATSSRGGRRNSSAWSVSRAGEQRELEIACALAGEPTLLLLDEPTSGLSQAETRRMIARISGLPRTIGLLMIEHDLDVVFSIADRLSVLYYGEVIASGPPNEVSSDARVREVYLGTHT
jgi:branched-chain amino acid transport system ATP-binding protein